MSRLALASFSVTVLACAFACGGAVDETPRTEPQPICTDEDVETGSPITALDARDDDVAWGTESGTVAVRRKGTTTVLAQLQAPIRVLALSRAAVFAATTDGPVERIDLQSHESVDLITDVIHTMALASNGDVTCYLDRASSRTGWLRCFYGDTVVLEQHDLVSVNGLTLDANAAYVSAFPATLRVPFDGTPPVQVAPQTATAIASDASRVYVASDGGATTIFAARVSAWAKSGSDFGTSGTPILDQRGTLRGLAVAGGSVWVSLDASTARIVKSPVSGGPTSVVADAGSDGGSGGWELLRGGSRALFRAWASPRATPHPHIEKRCF